MLGDGIFSIFTAFSLAYLSLEDHGLIYVPSSSVRRDRLMLFPYPDLFLFIGLDLSVGPCNSPTISHEFQGCQFLSTETFQGDKN